ncbi:hypothetical protein BGZ83_005585 [Gryganskiella cystojenkinii]|nr:hypothetical protein BGZ83_005585 [Gryganskiella cystojenkinii]
MIQARRFHSNVFFFIPLTQGVLLIILLDFCKNAAFFGGQVKNLSLTTSTTTGDGVIIKRPKDPAYLAAQYIYAIWLILMMVKAVIGFRANLKLLLQGYGFFCAWIHLKWVCAEMPHLLAPTLPAQSLLGLMFPMAVNGPSVRVNQQEPVMTEQRQQTTVQDGSLPSSEAATELTTEGAASITAAEAMPETAISIPTSTNDTESTPTTQQPGPSLPPLPPPLPAVPEVSSKLPAVSGRSYDARSLAGMSAITLTPPTSYGSQATHSRGRTYSSSSSSPPVSRDDRSKGAATMEVVVER